MAALAAAALVLLALQVLPAVSHQQLLTAEQPGSCRASFPEGSLDLTPLDTLNATGKPRFSNFATAQISGIGYQLSFNPCTGFQCNSDAAAAVCATDVYAIGLRLDVASQTGSSIIRSNGTLQIRYTSVDKAQGRDFVATLTLVCNASSGSVDSLTGVSLSEANELTFRLVSRHCCLWPNPPASGSWSPGDFIVFFFCLILLLYGLTFLAINLFYLKRSGLDLLPHRGFWGYLALLVKDGCVFTFTVVRGKVYQRGGYTEIK